jgi:hypothetical protein
VWQWQWQINSGYTHAYDDPCLGRDYGLQLIYVDFWLFFRLVDILALIKRRRRAVARLCGVVHVVEQEACKERSSGGGGTTELDPGQAG